MRVLALSIATIVATSACGRRTSTSTSTAAAPSAPLASTLDATVVGPDGPVTGARVRMLALAAAPCPCTPSELEAGLGYGNEVPACACPEALAQWRSRLARCDAAAGFVAELHANPQGRLRLEPTRGVTSLEAVGPAGVLWMRWPTANAPIALSLSKPTQPTIKITGAGPDVIRGAVLFEDGHCIPLERVGDAWRPRVALPESERTEGTVVIEATGYATAVVTLFSQDQIELFPATPVTGTCEGTTVRFENPFQRLVVKVDTKKQFSIDGALAMASKVSCWEDAQTLVDEWDYTPGEALVGSGTISGGLIGAPCTDVKVMDAYNRSIANASVSLMSDHGGGYSSGTSVSTDAQGVACVEDLHVGATLHVTAPQGPCAGETAQKITQRHLAQTPLMMRLRIQPLKGTTLRGRVLAPDGSPVAGASVTVKEVRPTNPADCTDTAAAQSGLDGAFSIRSLPRGTVVLETEHEWFGKRELTVKHDGSVHDVLLPRGERWSGRLLDPEGRPINTCSMSLKLADGRTLYTSCNAGAFELRPIAPGEARLQVRIENDALGTFRSLIRNVRLTATPRRDDIQFEAGEHISGRVLDKNGTAIPRAQLAALPKGAIKPYNRAHDDEVHITADELGRFTFRHLAPGTWTLHGVGRSYTQASIDVATGTTDAIFIVPPT